MTALLALGGSAMAQKNIKLGHINSNELMQIMPGRDSAQAALQKEVEALQAELETMNKEFEAKYNDYIAKRDQLSELIRKTKESDLQSMRARIEESNQNAQKLLFVPFDHDPVSADLFSVVVDAVPAVVDEQAHTSSSSMIRCLS